MTVLIIIGSILLILIILLNIPVRVRAAYYEKKLSYDVKYAAFTLIDSEKSEEPDGDKKPKRPKKPRKKDEEDTSGAEETEDEDDPAEEKPPDEAKAEDAPDTPETPDGKDDDDKAEKPAENSAEKPAEKSAKKKRKKPVSLIPKEHLADRIIEAAEGLTDKIEAVKLLIDLVWDDLIKLIKKVYFTGLVIDFTAADEDAAAAAISYGRMNAVVYDAIATVKVLTRLDVKSVRIDCLYDTPKDKAQYNGEITLRLRPASLVNAVFAVLFRFLFHIKKYKPILDTFLKK